MHASTTLLGFLMAACSAAPTAHTPASAPKIPAVEPAPVLVESVLPPVQVAESNQSAAQTQSPIEAALSAADRSDDDRALDGQRKPEQMLAFFGIEPGQQVAELGAGGGYTTELLARVVGPAGKVYGQNSKFILERFAEGPWSNRLAKPVMSNVVRLDTPFDAPFPPEVHDLDAVLIVLFYHDTVWQKVDRSRMNQAIYAALKPGGVFGVVDHSAREGAGVTETQTLHRISEKDVVREITAAGFALEASADFLKNPDDARDWNASPSKAGERRGTSDRFVLRFVKPKP